MANLSISDECIGCGACAGVAPELFMLEGEKAKVLVSEISAEQMESARSAASTCPVSAIVIK